MRDLAAAAPAAAVLITDARDVVFRGEGECLDDDALRRVAGPPVNGGVADITVRGAQRWASDITVRGAQRWASGITRWASGITVRGAQRWASDIMVRGAQRWASGITRHHGPWCPTLLPAALLALYSAAHALALRPRGGDRGCVDGGNDQHLVTAAAYAADPPLCILPNDLTRQDAV
eukprot:gene43779-47382_t